MFSKAEKNYYIDMALAIASIVCILTGFMLIREEIFQSMAFDIDRIHTSSEVVMTALVATGANSKEKEPKVFGGK